MLRKAFLITAILALSQNYFISVEVEARDNSPLSSAIQHLVVILHENHSFDTYFGRYCEAPTGSQPTCTLGRSCCESGPTRDPGGTGYSPALLTNESNLAFDPDHSQGCELYEIHGGKMDRYLNAGNSCGDVRNFAYADSHSAALYWKLADQGALADRYFQPIAGASSSNDMYLARAQFVFNDNEVEPLSIGSNCGGANPNRRVFDNVTIGDLLNANGVSWAFYAEGYRAMFEAQSHGSCPAPDPGCPIGKAEYPCIYDPSDNPFQYYRSTRDNPHVMKDFSAFSEDLRSAHFPAVNFVKALGYKSEHPGVANLHDGHDFVAHVLQTIRSSAYASQTLILLTMDESGGYFDHVSPPANSSADGKPYGPRIPLLAIGPFVKAGHVSHVEMEHSSIVRFIEWNWLGGQTGQLHGRDAVVNNLGSLLDPSRTRVVVPVH